MHKIITRLTLLTLVFGFCLGGYSQTTTDEDIRLVTPCYVAGDPTKGGAASLDVALVSITNQTLQKETLATSGEIGATYGVGYQSSSNFIFTSAVLKRHSGWGPLGPGGIYVVNADGSGVEPGLSFSLEELGVEVGGSIISSAVRNLPADPTQDSYDATAFNLIGRAGMGDLEMSQDQETIYVVNLFDKKIYAIDIGRTYNAKPQRTDLISYEIPNPGCSNTGDYIPWGLKFKDGKLYVGVVCTAEISRQASDLAAYVYELDLSTGVFNPNPVFVMDDMTYERGKLRRDLLSTNTPGPLNVDAVWQPWAISWDQLGPVNDLVTFYSQIFPENDQIIYENGYPQPILSDIEFADDGSMILGFSDRAGLQMGYEAYGTEPTDKHPSGQQRLYSGNSAGDILRACKDGDIFVIENNASLDCDLNITTDGRGNGEGPGGGEFYFRDNFLKTITDPQTNTQSKETFHDEITLGALAFIPNSGEIVVTAFDPQDDKDFSGGLIWMDNNTGVRVKDYVIFQTEVEEGEPNEPFLNPATFGKATGLGDIEFLIPGPPIPVCDTLAGSLTGVELDPNTDCLGDRVFISAVPNGDAVIPDGYNRLFVLTSGEELVIEAVNQEAEFFVDEVGLFTIHTLIYNPDQESADFLDLGTIEFGSTTGAQVLNLIDSLGICADLDAEGAPFNVKKCCVADAGTISLNGEAPCKNPNAFGIIQLSPGEDLIVPEGYKFLYFRSQAGTDIIQTRTSQPQFLIRELGTYTIQLLVYTDDQNSPDFFDLSKIENNQTSFAELAELVNTGSLCADLSNEIIVEIEECCNAEAGGMNEPKGECEDEITYRISASPDGEAVIPNGSSQLYVLTSGEELTILEVGSDPSFLVEEAGIYTIHSFVLPTELIATVAGLVAEGEITTGGDALQLIDSLKICASLDVEGERFEITEEILESCALSCDAVAGTMVNPTEECGEPAELKISAISEGAIIPDTYAQIFVLTSGEGLLIENTNTSPEFSITSPGSYTIHSLVYDPDPTSANFLDLSGIVPGESTGFDVLSLIANICASLDVPGSSFDITDDKIEECTPPPPCEAEAGITIALDTDCGDEVALITAQSDSAVVPEGYSQLYVLTTGAELSIEAVNGEGSFEVTKEGSYTVHSFVLQTDLIETVAGLIAAGTVATGGDALALIDSLDLCADLDVAGVVFNIDELCPPPPPCEAEAGITIALDTVCGDEVALITAQSDSAVVPEGYSQLYVLTTGAELSIEAVNGEGSFEVAKEGSYTVHSFVLQTDLIETVAGLIAAGTVATGGDALALIDSLDLCADLDVAGVVFNIDELCPPPPPCEAEAGITIALDTVCGDVLLRLPVSWH